jgi:Na+-transporting NADH:ubiquinone oxidoreductase subunit D
MDQQIFEQTAERTIFVANEFMALPASAFFIIGLIIWALRCWKPTQVEAREFDSGDED